MYVYNSYLYYYQYANELISNLGEFEISCVAK